MATREQFCAAMIEAYHNHIVYIGGANGERTESLTIGKIRQLEENYPNRNHASDINRDLCFIGKCYKNGLDMSKSNAADCSGLPTYILRSLGVIGPKDDYQARTYQKLSKAVPLNELQPGDFVFNKTSEATHMGTYVGEGLVVESEGRDVGGVCKNVNEGPWVVGGRLDWFDDDIPVLTRNLKYVKNDLMKGNDVRECQMRLKVKGYDPGKIDGVYGINTRDAVVEFQTDNRLDVDGVVGPKTWNKLWS